ncbi:MAG: class I SAM-dependent methyltransferase [Flammeovirgaceae bacterium]|nr:class I SAM-dependent methyltransferase [Flammeovirgaceae bacterium]
MSKVYSTEITSEKIPSDNPIHQRLLKAYILAAPFVKGDVLEIGCGEGRGVELLAKGAESYTAIDKLDGVIRQLQEKYPNGKFISGNLPPLSHFDENQFDSAFSFQVIEHIQNDLFYLKEIHRVLKPGGIAMITTPNRKMSLSRNPWHIREYTATELQTLASSVFERVEVKGISGNSKVMEYYERNKKSVDRIMRWDILNLQYRLPSVLLRIPYEFMNRRNRNTLKTSADELVMSISHTDYIQTEDPDHALDLLLILRKGNQ